jgi:serine/threonine protein kinase/tetratricopeptide (TPR) repeat protein
MGNKCPICHSENPDTQRFCGGCGTHLPPPQGQPPVMTETLQTPVHELSTGSTFAGRYQVIEELGHGGMGKVYKVFDTDIKEKIALKLLRPEIALDKETIERFSNELKLARKISHRNVCRMFDLGKADGTTFITMEFVPGEDLKKLIRKIGKQVCEGLAEAHHLGVVHRDLKPQNIMVDEDGNARIMDFGIARSLRGKGITGAGVMIGTPEYMSPEQVEGKEVDQRSDIYSLGIILYEMATGHVPFEGDTAFTIGVKHKSERPRNPRELNAQLTEDLSRLILRCLEKDKGKRFQTAEELGTDLDKVEQGLPTTERMAPKRKSFTSKEITVTFSARKLVIPAIAILGLAIFGFVLWQVIPSRKPALFPSASGQPTLAVLYFENKSGDPKLDNWRDGLAELLIADLQQSRYVRVISGDEMYTILKRLGLADARKYSSDDIEKIAAQSRASHVLRGNYFKAGEGFVITAGLQKPGAGGSPSALRIDARDEKDIIAKVDELARQVKEGLNLTAAQISSDFEREAGKITTSSPEAFKYYVEGRRLHTETKYEQAIAYMEKAVELDPEFAMAFRAMAVSHYNLKHWVEGQKYLKRALELSARLPDNERLLIEADIFFYEEKYAKAVEVLEKLLQTYPDNVYAHYALGKIYNWASDDEKACGPQEFVVQKRRTAIDVGNLAISYMAKGLYQKAEDICQSFLKEAEDNDYVRYELCISYLCRGQFDFAFAEAEKTYFLNPADKYLMAWVLLSRDDLVGAGKYSDGISLLTRGKFAENIDRSLRTQEESIRDDEYWAEPRRGLSTALEKAGRYEDAYQAFGQYLRRSAEYKKSAGEPGPPYLLLQQKSDLFDKGRIQAEIGSFEEARKTAEELKSLIDQSISANELRWYEHILGLIELGKKDYSKAADLFSRACGRLESESINFMGHALYFDALARARYELGDMNGAWKQYEKITRLTLGRLYSGDIYAKAFYMLGKIAEQQGDKVQARQNLTKFLDLWKDADPGIPEVDDASKRLAGLKGS